MSNIVPWGKSERDTALEQRADHPLSVFREGFDSLFNRFFERWSSPFGLDQWQAGAGLETDESEKEYFVRIDAPGFEAKDFDVQMTGNMLTVKAEHKQEAVKKNGNGRSFGERRLYRAVSLPAGADVSKVGAHYKNGVLELRLPKTPAVQGRRIEVKA